MLDRLKKKISVSLDLADLIPDVLLSRMGFDERAKYLFEHVEQAIQAIENDASVSTRDAAIHRLRTLGLDDFAFLLWALPSQRYRKLTALLPSMASAETQRHWTGRSGVALLKPTVNFVRVLAYNYARITGKSLDESTRILDYGCGYGRIARLMYYFADEPNVFGVDPWDQSLAQCKQAGLNGNFLQSDYIPTSLPVTGSFDLMYAYSVFTHLAERPALAALKTLRKYARENSVLVITVRPVEYWDLTRYIPSTTARRLTSQHRQNGFAFYPHPGEHNTGEVVYGDTSISIDWLERNCPEWKVAIVDRLLTDRLQTYVYLTPR